MGFVHFARKTVLNFYQIDKIYKVAKKRKKSLKNLDTIIKKC